MVIWGQKCILKNRTPGAQIEPIRYLISIYVSIIRDACDKLFVSISTPMKYLPIKLVFSNIIQLEFHDKFFVDTNLKSQLKYVIVSQSNANCLQIYPLFAFLELN